MVSLAGSRPIRVVSGGDETQSLVPPSAAILFKLKQSPANATFWAVERPESWISCKHPLGNWPQHSLLYLLCFLLFIWWRNRATSGSFSVHLSFYVVFWSRLQHILQHDSISIPPPCLPLCNNICYLKLIHLISILFFFNNWVFDSRRWLLRVTFCLLFPLSLKMASVNPLSCC